MDSPALATSGSALNFLYVDGSSYSDQLKISRWSSSGFPANASVPDDCEAPPVEPVPVVVPPQADSSMSPPSPRALRRDRGWPAASSTRWWSRSSFGLVARGASRLI